MHRIHELKNWVTEKYALYIIYKMIPVSVNTHTHTHRYMYE